MPIQLKNATPPASNQDAFDRVWQHFIVEGNPKCIKHSPHTNSKCVYRYEGNGCAVGCMLPDDLAEAADAISGAILLTGIWGICKDWLSHVDRQFLKDLQDWHDGPCMNAEHLGGVGREWNLNVPC